MADSILVFNKQSDNPDTIEVFFSADTGNDFKVKAFTASNNTETSQSYRAYIYNAGGGSVPPIIPMTIVVRDRKHHGESIVGQIIPANGSLRIESSSANGLNFYVTGQEL